MMRHEDAQINTSGNQCGELSFAVIPLMKGVIYQEDNNEQWDVLIRTQARIREYVAVLGLELMLDEAEGYAYLRSCPDHENDGVITIPRLIVRRQYSYPVSLLLALLRKKLAEFDAGGDESRLILSRDDVVEMIRIFLPDESNEVKIIDQVDGTLNTIAKLGFIRRLRGQKNMIEVRRIIKAFVDAQWLADFDQRLAEYREQIVQSGESMDE